MARPHSAPALVAKTDALLTTGAQTITTRGEILLQRDRNNSEQHVMIEVLKTQSIKVFFQSYSSVFQVSGRASMMSLVSLLQRLPSSPTPSPAVRTRPEARHARPDQYPFHTWDLTPGTASDTSHQNPAPFNNISFGKYVFFHMGH